MEPSSSARLASAARDAMVRAFGTHEHVRVAIAPGRVNLIGEHTDYNDGFVLPMALDRSVVVAFEAGAVGRVRAHTIAFNDTRETHFDTIEQTRSTGWFAYVAGVAWSLLLERHSLRGADLVFAGDVPVGAGLSSSAALELATARALCAAAEIEWDAVAMARVAQRAEREFVGVACGIMDQYVSAMARAVCALLLDCRSLESRPVTIPANARFVVMDTGVRRALAGSAYNERRAACERAVTAVRRLSPDVRALRDVSADLLQRGRAWMDEAAFRRAAHVVAETGRPGALAQALATADLETAGSLMNDSHASLRDLYEVSCPELDVMVEEARRLRGCTGARMTGAGFGGCAVALVAAEHAEAFCEQVAAAYARRTGRSGDVFVVRPSAGARLME
jgi:galactokinase